MKKNVFINNTAATSGGALNILRQVLDNIKDDSCCTYYIFCTVDISEEYKSDNIKFISNIKGKRWRDRILWDLYGLKKWSKQTHIYPDIIISLQNTGVRFSKNIKQIIYLHQPLPFCEEKWNIFNKQERLLWFYKNIYDKWIRLTINKSSIIVVQSEWLKKKVSDKYKIELKRIYDIKPNVKIVDEKKEDRNNFNIQLSKNKYKIFYPASDYKYKNHEIIIKSMIIIKEKYKEIYDNIEVYFTLDKLQSEYLYNEVKKYNLLKSIKFIGYLESCELDETYKKCDLVIFPSYIETFGLPLIEAAQYAKPIIASDLEYAHDVIDGYEGVNFISYKDEYQWANCIVNNYKNRKQYNKFIPNYSKSWNEFIKLIYENI